MVRLMSAGECSTKLPPTMTPALLTRMSISVPESRRCAHARLELGRIGQVHRVDVDPEARPECVCGRVHRHVRPG